MPSLWLPFTQLISVVFQKINVLKTKSSIAIVRLAWNNLF